MKASSSPLFRNRKEKLASVIVLGFILLGFVLIFVPVHAYTPTVANVDAGAWASGTTYTVTQTVALSGDTIAVFTSIRTFVANTVYTTLSVSSPGVSGGFTNVGEQAVACNGNPGDTLCGGVLGQNWAAVEDLWVGTATSSGTLTLTITISNGGANAAGTAAIGYDLQFVGTPTVTSTFCPAVYQTSCNSPIVTGSIPSSTAGIQTMGAVAFSALPSGAGAPCTYVSSGASASSGEYQLLSAGVTSGCFINYQGNTGFETGSAMLNAVWGSSTGSGSTTTTTTTINTMCANCGHNNGTQTYAVNNELYFYYSQNVQTYGTLDNLTVFVKSVHINANTGTLYFLFYSTFNSNPPTGGNQWQLASGYTVPFTVINGTSNFYIHLNPQFAIGSLQWFAVAFMATTTASRGSGASGSGISLAEVTQPTSLEYQYAVGSSTPPATFFSNTQKTNSHWDWVFYHIIYPVTVVTSTVTSTSIQGATATSTVLVTFTATSLDITTAPGAFTNYAELLIVILTPAMIICVPIAAYTRSPSGAGIGFVAGLMIGSGLGVQAALVPPVFLGIMVIVGVFMIVGLSRAGGGVS